MAAALRALSQNNFCEFYGQQQWWWWVLWIHFEFRQLPAFIPYLAVAEVVRSSSGSSYFHFIWSIQGHLLPEESQQEGILVVNFASRKLGFWSRIMASLMMRWRTFFIQHTTARPPRLQTQPTSSSNSLQKLDSRQRSKPLLLLRFQSSTLLSISSVCFGFGFFFFFRTFNVFQIRLQNQVFGKESHAISPPWLHTKRRRCQWWQQHRQKATTF